MSKLFEKLAKVQSELKAPKNQRNAFGKYNYRSKEDILEAAKPLCIANGLCLTINDELLMIGDRYYVKSTATVTETVAKGESYSVGSYAREALTKKGMDESQITGAASAYSGKYALNNLFGIDDTKDADATNTGDKGEKPAVAKRTAAVKKQTPAATPAKAAPRKEAPKKEVKPDPASKQASPKKAAPAPKADAPTGAKTSGKAAAKKALTTEQRDNFLKGVEQGKFDLVEKHLKNYAVDAKSKAVTAALGKAKSGK